MFLKSYFCFFIKKALIQIFGTPATNALETITSFCHPHLLYVQITQQDDPSSTVGHIFHVFRVLLEKKYFPRIGIWHCNLLTHVFLPGHHCPYQDLQISS